MGCEMAAFEVGGVDPLVEHHGSLSTFVCSVRGHDDVGHPRSPIVLCCPHQRYSPNFRLRKYLVADVLEIGRAPRGPRECPQPPAGWTMRMWLPNGSRTPMSVP